MMSATSTLAMTHASSMLELAKELDKNKVTPGVLGFIVFALLGAAVWMLLKSMNKHVGKVDFEEQSEPDTTSAVSTNGAPGDSTA